MLYYSVGLLANGQPDPARFGKPGAPDLHLMLAAVADNFFMLTKHHHHQSTIATMPSSAHKTRQTQAFHAQYPEFDLDPLPFKIRDFFKTQYLVSQEFSLVPSPLDTIRSGLLGMINENDTQEALVFIDGYMKALGLPQLLTHFKTLARPIIEDTLPHAPSAFDQIPYYSWESCPTQEAWPVAYRFWKDIVSHGNTNKLVFWLTDILTHYVIPLLIGALVNRRAFGQTLTLLNGLAALSPLTEWLEADRRRRIDYYELAMFLTLYVGKNGDQELDNFLAEAQTRLKADLEYLAECPMFYRLDWEQTARHHAIFDGYQPPSAQTDRTQPKPCCTT
ncbi:hypothetical protein H4R34_002061 [Dimargaris verticillata]|uniref:Uncharacterized protein n=1 Tax=Dimargaris verticillata TaxID=2761393 RepID=A0A9W8EAB7_9FUNG|nr:hypothetical protein H4R34_002061 [Dimargaris verticillata]